MKKVKEILSSDNSFFTAFKNNYPDLYFDLFEEADPLEMDTDILVCCGEKYAAPLISYQSMSFAVNWILRRYKDNWKKIKDALTAEYNLLKPMANRTVTTQDIEGMKEDTGTSQQANSINGFDSTSLTGVPSDGSTSTDSGKQDTHQHSVTTVESDGNAGQFTNQSMILNELELRKRSFVDIVIRDISTQITLDIY